MTLENGQFMPKTLKVNNYSHVNISKRSKLDVCVSFLLFFIFPSFSLSLFSFFFILIFHLHHLLFHLLLLLLFG